MRPDNRTPLTLLVLSLLVLALAGPALAESPLDKFGDYTRTFNLSQCTWTNTGGNLYFPLDPGLEATLEGTEEDDEGDEVDIEAIITVLDETEMVDGVETRVVEERESEDGELVEVSRNFFAMCVETGDVFYFGEDVDDYEDGQIVGHGGAWRAGENGARPGIIMPGQPLLGARYFEEIALQDEALDWAEIYARNINVETPWGEVRQALVTFGGSALDPEEEPEMKVYGRGMGVVVDEDLELVDIVFP